MPYVNIKVAKTGLSAQQKDQLIAGITRLLVEVLNKDPDSVFVVIDEVDTDNWGVGGQSLTTIFARPK